MDPKQEDTVPPSTHCSHEYGKYKYFYFKNSCNEYTCFQEVLTCALKTPNQIVYKEQVAHEICTVLPSAEFHQS